MAHAKKSSRSRYKSASASRAASNYFFEDVLALAGTLADRKKLWGAERISEFAEVTREFSSSLTDIPRLGNYVNAVADTLEDFSGYMKETEFQQIVVDASTFARRHPVVVMTGGVLAGFAAMQILRSDGTFLKSRGSAKTSRRGGKAQGAAAGGSKRINGHAHLH